MGQKKPREKTADELQAERVTAALEETDRIGHAPTFVRKDPGAFLREFYEVWHRQGGMEGGRPRNSIRKMREQWLTGRNHVPSLHPKLMGRVKLTRSDARALIDLFLGRWRYAEGHDPLRMITSDGYVGFPVQDRKRLKNAVLRALVKSGEPAVIAMPRQGREQDTIEETKKRWVNVEQVLSESNALITLSRHRITVESNNVETMMKFWHIMNHFYLSDQGDGHNDRIFIWVIDIGQRLVEQQFSFDEYFNAGLLALQLKSFASFDSLYDDERYKPSSLLPHLRIAEDVYRNQRWEWLNRRTVIVVQNLRREEFDGLYADQDEAPDSIRLKEIGVTAEHILPNKTPREWAKPLRHLYGRNTEAADATITVFYKRLDRSSALSGRDVRYFAHGPALAGSRATSDTLPNVALSTRSAELQSPDQHYDDAFRLLYWAARFRLGMGDETERQESLVALAYLQKHGFRFLRVHDFLRVFAMPSTSS